MTNLPITSNNFQPPAKLAPKTTNGFSQAENAASQQSSSRSPASGNSENRSSGGTPARMTGNGSSSASGNTANTAQTSNAANTKTVASQDADIPSTGSFATLLARQIGETDLLTLDSAQVAVALNGKITGDSAKLTLKEVQDQIAAPASTPIDSTSALAALLLQLPQEIRAQITNDAAAGATTSTTGIDTASLDASSASNSSAARQDLAKLNMSNPGMPMPPDATKPDMTTSDTTKPDTVKLDMAKPDIAKLTPDKIDASAIAADKQIISDALARDAVKQAALSPGLPQPNQNIVQAASSPAMSGVMPNMLMGNNIASTRQSISTPLDNSGWADDFSQKITWISTQRNQIAELHLNPPDLGPLNVVMKISDNQATVLFTSPHSAVRDAVENALPKLRETLAENGITLGNTTVSDQPAQDRNKEGLMNQGSGAPTQNEISAETPPSAGAASTATAPVRRHIGMVDTFA